MTLGRFYDTKSRWFPFHHKVCHEQRLVFQKERYGAAATGKLERTNAKAGVYATATEDAAAKAKVRCVNLWALMQQKAWDVSPG